MKLRTDVGHYFGQNGGSKNALVPWVLASKLLFCGCSGWSPTPKQQITNLHTRFNSIILIGVSFPHRLKNLLCLYVAYSKASVSFHPVHTIHKALTEENVVVEMARSKVKAFI